MEEAKYYERKRWTFFGLPFTFTTYSITEELLTINAGFFKKVENDCYMYKIQDVTLTRTIFERLFGLGTIVCYTGDSTHPQLVLEHIRNSAEIKAYIIKASEEIRMKRRTLNTLNISADQLDEMEADAE